jgi:hypothetical protein
MRNLQVDAISLKPWTQGVRESRDGGHGIHGAKWNYVLIFELFAPLRNKLMFEPEEIWLALEWEKYSRAVTDCHIDPIGDIRPNSTDIIWSTANIRTITMNTKANSIYTGSPAGTGNVHADILHWLDAVQQDFVCLATDVVDAACADIRAKWRLAPGEYSDCWVAGYTGIYGEAPVHDRWVNVAHCTRYTILVLTIRILTMHSPYAYSPYAYSPYAYSPYSPYSTLRATTYCASCSRDSAGEWAPSAASADSVLDPYIA